MKWRPRDSVFTDHESRITKKGRPAAALAVRLGWMAAAGCDPCLSFTSRVLRRQASAYCFSLRAIQATAAESRLLDRARSEACRHSSTARRARNVRSGVSRSHWHSFRPFEASSLVFARKPEKFASRTASRKMPHNSGSRILDRRFRTMAALLFLQDDVATPHASGSRSRACWAHCRRRSWIFLALQLRNLLSAARRPMPLRFPVPSPLDTAAAKCRRTDVKGMWRHGTFSPRLSAGTNCISRHSAHGARFSLVS